MFDKEGVVFFVCILNMKVEECKSGLAQTFADFG